MIEKIVETEAIDPAVDPNKIDLKTAGHTLKDLVVEKVTVNIAGKNGLQPIDIFLKQFILTTVFFNLFITDTENQSRDKNPILIIVNEEEEEGGICSGVKMRTQRPPAEDSNYMSSSDDESSVPN